MARRQDEIAASGWRATGRSPDHLQESDSPEPAFHPFSGYPGASWAWGGAAASLGSQLRVPREPIGGARTARHTWVGSVAERRAAEAAPDQPAAGEQAAA